jgi:hypothetical protein
MKLDMHTNDMQTTEHVRAFYLKPKETRMPIAYDL